MGRRRAPAGAWRGVAVALIVVLGTLTPAVGAGLPDEFEPNDSPEEAAGIEPGEYDGLRIEDGESDFFALDLDAGDRLRAAVAFPHARGDLDLAVYGPDADRLAASQSVTDNESASVVVPASGTYYVEIYGFDGATTPYSLSVAAEELENDRFEPNEAPEEAVPVTADGRVEDLRIVTGERDVFAVNLDAGERFEATIRFDHDEGDLDLAVLDSGGDPIGESYSTTDNESVTVTATQSAVYYVRVDGYANATANYSLATAGDGDVPPLERRSVADGGRTNVTSTVSNRNATLTVQGATATPGASVTLRYNLTNTGDRTRTFVLDSGLADLPASWEATSTSAEVGEWRADRRVWVFRGIDPGERVVAEASVLVPIWAPVPTTEAFEAAVFTRDDRLTVAARVQVRSTSVAAAVDRDGDGRIGDGELLAAIEWWRAGESIPGTDITISDAELETLIDRWRV